MTARLQLAYYLGAYGPTIWIDAQDQEDLAAIGGLFRRLASGRTPCIRSSPRGEKAEKKKALTLHAVVAGWREAKSSWYSVIRCHTELENAQKCHDLDSNA
jgi:hypothetical protein